MFRSEATATYSPREAFIHALLNINKLPMQSLVNSEYGAGVMLELSTIFPWSGRFIRFGKLVNGFAWKVMNKTIIPVWLIGKYVSVMFDYFTGQVNHESDDEKAFRLGMETGQVWAPTIYHTFKGLSFIELGLKKEAERVLSNMYTLATSLENSLSLAQYFRSQQTFRLKFRKLDDLIEHSGNILTTTLKTDHKTQLFLNYCLTSVAYCLNHNPEQARIYFLKAEVMNTTLWLNYYTSMTLLTRSFIQLAELTTPEKKEPGELLIRFHNTTSALLKASKKVFCTKTEAFRFRAISYSYLNKPVQAIRYFKKSITFAQWYGSNIELSRTYFELGKFLSDPTTKINRMNGHSGAYYLGIARRMFEEIGLEWDLEQLRKYS